MQVMHNLVSTRIQSGCPVSLIVVGNSHVERHFILSNCNKFFSMCTCPDRLTNHSPLWDDSSTQFNISMMLMEVKLGNKENTEVAIRIRNRSNKFQEELDGKHWSTQWRNKMWTKTQGKKCGYILTTLRLMLLPMEKKK